MSAAAGKRRALRDVIARAVAEHDEVAAAEAIDDPNGDGYSLHTVETHLERAMGVIAGGLHDDIGFDAGELEKVLALLATTRREVQNIRSALERAGVLRGWKLREAYEHLAPRAVEDDDDGDEGDPAEASDDAAENDADEGSDGASQEAH